MDILIKGLALPKKGTTEVTIYEDGHVLYEQDDGQYIEMGDAKAIELPPHGRLIEENKAYDSIMEQTVNHYIDMDGVDLGLQNAPTVLEAST